MKKATQFFFKVLRHLYARRRRMGAIPKSEVYWRPELSQVLCDVMADDAPCMVARFGLTEMNLLSRYYVDNYMDCSYAAKCWHYIQGWAPLPGEWGIEPVKNLCRFSGFYPADLELGRRFCELMMESASQLDVLGSWMSYERLFAHLHHAKRVNLCNLEPFDDSHNPWSRYLEGKRVLVVHPFASTIEKQYKTKRELLFRDPRILPQFELKTIKAVQSLNGVAHPGLETWFDALDYMRSEIDKVDYDVCLLGCGAYGFPLAAHIKRTGRQAFHLGGSLQLLFGIKGKRWTEQYGQNNPYLKHFNEHWVFPSDDERPADAQKIENACYW